MNENQQAPSTEINLSSQQVGQAAMAALTFLSLETTLIPGNLRRQLDVLEVVLTGLTSGKLIVASPDQLAVELPSDRKEPNDDGSGKTPQAAIEKGRESTRPELPKAAAKVASPNRTPRSDAGAS